MEKDVVCGIQVDPATAAGTSQHAGKTYYFCSKACKGKFDANPTQYTKESDNRGVWGYRRAAHRLGAFRL